MCSILPKKNVTNVTESTPGDYFQNLDRWFESSRAYHNKIKELENYL